MSANPIMKYFAYAHLPPVRAILPLLMILLLAGCSTIPGAWVKAERATFRAIAPEYLAYVTTDSSLLPVDRELRVATLLTWDERIAAAERNLGVAPPPPFPPADSGGPEASAGLKSLGGSPTP